MDAQIRMVALSARAFEINDGSAEFFNSLLDLEWLRRTIDENFAVRSAANN
jgi:hypothetical protein